MTVSPQFNVNRARLPGLPSSRGRPLLSLFKLFAACLLLASDGERRQAAAESPGSRIRDQAKSISFTIAV